MKRWNEWTPEQRQASRAKAANMFLNMGPCADCGLPWPTGYVHLDCPGPRKGETWCPSCRAGACGAHSL